MTPWPDRSGGGAGGSSGPGRPASNTGHSADEERGVNSDDVRLASDAQLVVAIGRFRQDALAEVVPAPRGRGVRARAPDRRRSHAGRGGRAGGVPPALEPARPLRPRRGGRCVRTCSRRRTAAASTSSGRRRRAGRREEREAMMDPARPTTSSARCGTSPRPSTCARRSRSSADGRAGRDRAGVLRRPHLPGGRHAARRAGGHGEEPDPVGTEPAARRAGRHRDRGMARELSGQELDDLLGAYALDAVDGDEREQVEAYLDREPAARTPGRRVPRSGGAAHASRARRRRSSCGSASRSRSTSTGHHAARRSSPSRRAAHGPAAGS